jgi:hypothetical protein
VPKSQEPKSPRAQEAQEPKSPRAPSTQDVIQVPKTHELKRPVELHLSNQEPKYSRAQEGPKSPSYQGRAQEPKEGHKSPRKETIAQVELHLSNLKYLWNPKNEGKGL